MVGWLIFFGYIIMGGIVSALSQRFFGSIDSGFIIACWIFWPMFICAYAVVGIGWCFIVGWKFIAGTL